MMNRLSSSLLFLLASAYTTLAASSNELVSREYTNPDPANDPKNLLGYVPQKKYTYMALLAFGSIAATQTYLMVRYKGFFMLAMLICEFTFAAGIALRLLLHNDPTRMGIYIAENSLVVLSPVGFIAANYVLLGRMARWLKCNSYMLVRPERVTLFFVTSDVVTFFVQASGGGLSAAGADKAELGAKVFLVGLILQAISFVFFTIMYIHFLINVKKHESRIWNRDAGNGMLKDWRGLAGALFASCVFILIRSVYRIAELSQGYGGAISKNETLFYLFDVLMLFHAVMVYTPFWPGKFIPSKHDMEMEALKSHDSSENLAAYKGRV
ncbi:hypothetical protein QCA50_015395 [Cerrena zonata]|uniref:Uncharacterized protein n=1 Tax=Cerrena zonata TaxID=2478898 RepID=A0AAW0FWC8_9APHY